MLLKYLVIKIKQVIDCLTENIKLEKLLVAEGIDQCAMRVGRIQNYADTFCKDMLSFHI